MAASTMGSGLPVVEGPPAPQGAVELYLGLKAGGVDFAVYLPDGTLPPVERLVRADPEIQTVQCAREDEGIAMAAGAYLGGKMPAALMEGSGLGYAGLILARIQLQRTPVLLIASRNRVLDEPFDYHGATRKTGEGVLRGLDIPYLVVTDPSQLRVIVEKAALTVWGQRSCVGLFIPNYVIHGQ